MLPLSHKVVDRGEEAVAYGLCYIVDALLQASEPLRLGLLDRRRHLLGDAGTLPHRVVKIEDVVLQIPGLGIQQINEGDGFGVPKSLLQLHLLSGVHCLAELAPKLFEDFRHRQELVVGVKEGEAQCLAALRRRAEEGFVLCTGFRPSHGRLQHTEDCKLFFQRDVGGGGRRAQALDALGHAGAGRFERPDAFRYSSGEHFPELDVGEVVIVALIDAVAGGEQGGHFRGRRLGGLGGQGRESGKLGDALVRQRRYAALDVIGRADEVSLCGAAPLVGEVSGRALQRVQVFHAQRSQLTQGPARFKRGLHGCEHCAGDLGASPLHRGTRFDEPAEGLAQRVQLGHVCPHAGGDTGQRPGEVIDHVHNKRQFEDGF